MDLLFSSPSRTLTSTLYSLTVKLERTRRQWRYVYVCEHTHIITAHIYVHTHLSMDIWAFLLLYGNATVFTGQPPTYNVLVDIRLGRISILSLLTHNFKVSKKTKNKTLSISKSDNKQERTCTGEIIYFLLYITWDSL